MLKCLCELVLKGSKGQQTQTNPDHGGYNEESEHDGTWCWTSGGWYDNWVRNACICISEHLCQGTVCATRWTVPSWSMCYSTAEWGSAENYAVDKIRRCARDISTGCTSEEIDLSSTAAKRVRSVPPNGWPWRIQATASRLLQQSQKLRPKP